MDKCFLILILSLILGPYGPGQIAFAEICEDQLENSLPPIPTNVIKWMDYVSKDIPKVDQCETVEITNSLTISGKDFSTYGQGATFKSKSEPKKLFVLTAAHVVANSDSIEVRCGNKIIKAKVRGISETNDLAVLELEEAPTSFNPLFNWEGIDLPVAEVRHYLNVDNKDYLPKGTHIIHTAPEFIAPSDIHIVRKTDKGLEAIANRLNVETKLVTDSSQHPLIGSKNALILTKNGVRPGMSGSPIIYSVQVMNPNFQGQDSYVEKHFLSGVLVKTYLNETESVAVPIETINSALPSLMRGKDPAKESLSPYYFEKKLVGENQIPTVTIRTKDGEETFQSVCASPYTNTSGKGGSGDSSGKGGSGDSGGKGGSGDSSGKGGSGDSGGKGGSGDSGGKGGSGDSGNSSSSKDSHYNTGIFSLYRNPIGCKESGIKDSKGNIYLSVIKDDGVVAKAESIEDVSDLIQKHGADFPDYIRNHGVKKENSDLVYEKFCSDKNIFNNKGQPEKIKLERKDFDPKNPSVASYTSSGEMNNGDNLMGMSMKVSCNAQKKSIKVQASKGDFKTDITITPTTWSGSINFKGCESTFKNESKQIWIANHKDENLVLQMTISPDKSFLSFNIFAANPNCLNHSNANSIISFSSKPSTTAVWLSKVNLSLTDSKHHETYWSAKEEQGKKEETLLKSDYELAATAERTLKADKEKIESVLRTFQQREIEEIHKDRIGEVVSKNRLSFIQSQIYLLQHRLKN